MHQEEGDELNHGTKDKERPVVPQGAEHGPWKESGEL